MRLHISKIFGRVTLENFKAAARSVKYGMEKECGAVSMEIKLYAGAKQVASYVDDELDAILDRHNNIIRVGTFNNIASLTKDIWNKGTYIEANFRPIDEKSSPSYAYAHLECGGMNNKAMTVYAQGGEIPDRVASQMRHTFLFWKTEDSFKTNSFVWTPFN